MKELPLIIAVPVIVVLGLAALVCFAIDDLYRLIRRALR